VNIPVLERLRQENHIQGQPGIHIEILFLKKKNMYERQKWYIGTGHLP
jgi:hypothetical protein